MQNNPSMKDFVINLLKENLSAFYTYHNYEHTLYVAEQVQEIGKKEECNEEELRLLVTAALWHDTGYIKTYRNHEEESCNLARQYLPDFGYSPDEIDNVCSMIMVTKMPQTPKNILDNILADADLEYMGTQSFQKKSDDLFRELHTLDQGLTKEKWNKLQIEFMQNHHYFTKFCNEFREPVKQVHLNNLVEGYA